MRFIIAIILALCLATTFASGDALSQQFVAPPASARPWVYWFWNNGNVTKVGITADLEAMQRVGIGGVIIMDVVERFAPPPGPADFMNAQWQELFCFAVSEAHRLGLEINMTNGPGWCGSSGPWITPELSMQKLVTTAIAVEGPQVFSDHVPQPNVAGGRVVKYAPFYRDIAVLAYPQTADGSTPAESVVNLTDKLGADGTLNWKVPAGKWIIQRIGHTTTGATTRPPVKGGNGLECDKLSSAAMDFHFANMMAKLIGEVGPLAGTTLTATHVDSWEVGTQNWTPDFVKEFEKRRGYDPTPYLPDIAGATVWGMGVVASEHTHFAVGDPATVARFRWDFNTTVSELLAQNYIGHLEKLAQAHHLRLTLEGYDLPFGDEATYTAGADEPMTEFWATGAPQNEAKGREMASAAHIMGRNIVGAEAFTSGDTEQWKMHPATIKSLGDYEFCQGVNRFVIHRYAHQPYLDRFPGCTMGPWGLHYERTQTWWEMSTAWHEYLRRCQFMLRQGMFTADLVYLRPQLPDQTYFTADPKVPQGYKYDECTAEELMNRFTVRDGRLVLPDGMSYRLLVLPTNFRLMTPELMAKIRELVNDGATVLGPPPTGSPSLCDYVKWDAQVRQTAAELWGDCDGKTVTEHTLGKGKIIWGEPVEQVLAEQLHQPADFTSGAKLNWIHRHTDEAEIYFLANGEPFAVEATCNFRVKGLRPELWNPQTGEISPPAMYAQSESSVSVPLRFDPSGSMFVVFRSHPQAFDPVVSFKRDGEEVGASVKPPAIKILSATYGPPGDAQRTRDVRAKAQALVDQGELSFQVARMAEGDDPAYGVVKTLVVAYSVDGKPFKISGQDPEEISFLSPLEAAGPIAELRCDNSGQLSVAAREPGVYELKTASGKTLRAQISTIAKPLDLSDGWTVEFPPKWGAPAQITLDRLISLSDSDIPGVRYFSGTATYRRDFVWKPSANADDQVWLNLGDVQVMADVRVNGKKFGILWKAPFRADISSALKPGRNEMEIRVADLWPNRMIGDAALPENQRFTWSSYEPFTKDSPLPRSGLIGPVTVEAVRVEAVH